VPLLEFEPKAPATLENSWYQLKDLQRWQTFQYSEHSLKKLWFYMDSCAEAIVKRRRTTLLMILRIWN